MAIRRAAKVDDNQPGLVKYLRERGASVAITSAAHDGFPDIVVGMNNITVLVEIKDGNKTHSQRQLTPKQIEFHKAFKGAITVIETESHAQALLDKINQIKINTNWSMGAVAYATKGKAWNI